MYGWRYPRCCYAFGDPIGTRVAVAAKLDGKKVHSIVHVLGTEIKETARLPVGGS